MIRKVLNIAKNIRGGVNVASTSLTMRYGLYFGYVDASGIQAFFV